MFARTSIRCSLWTMSPRHSHSSIVQGDWNRTVSVRVTNRRAPKSEMLVVSMNVTNSLFGTDCTKINFTTIVIHYLHTNQYFPHSEDNVERLRSVVWDQITLKTAVELREGLERPGWERHDNKAHPSWIWWVIWNGFIARTLRTFVMGNCRF